MTILLIIAELSSKVQMMRAFWFFALVAVGINITMGIYVIVTGHQAYFSEDSFLWVILSMVELVIQIITIILGLKLVKQDPSWNDPKKRASFYQYNMQQTKKQPNN